MASDREIPFLVCTNTWLDYAVTVRRSVEPSIERWVVDTLLPTFAPLVANASLPFIAAVGVAAIPGNSDDIVAFRVFDSGVYRGRVHTVGIVACIVPRRGRPWPISALLAPLLPPAPDSDQYAAPWPCCGEIKPTVEPFSKLDEWDNGGNPPPADFALCFCSPPELSPPEIPVPMFGGHPVKNATASADRRFRRLKVAAGLLMIAMFLAVGYWWIFAPPPVVIVQESSSPLDDGRLRDRLISVLVRLHIQADAEARILSTADLKKLAVAAAADSRRGMIELHTLLGGQPDISFDTRRNSIKGWCESRPHAESAATAENPDEHAVQKALDFLISVYGPALDSAKNLIKRSSDEAGYRQFLEKLQSAG